MATELTWFGHGTWSIRVGEHRLLLDPFLDENPVASVKSRDVEADYILVSHGHFDHVADLVKVARRTGAMVVGVFEITEWAQKQGVEKAHGMNLGGGFDFPFGRVKLVQADHSSVLPDGTYGGAAAGFVLTLEGKKVYFACDTALFRDMELIGEEGLELAVLPIGDNYTMGPADSVRATQWLRPRRVAPMHYNTWPLIEQDANAWAEAIRRDTAAEPVVVQPGGKILL